MNKTLLVPYDTETTGKEPTTARVVQFAALAMVEGPDETMFALANCLCDPGIPIDPGASEVHGIYAKDIVNKPSDNIRLWQFVAYLNSVRKAGWNVILAGHNIDTFDKPIVERISGHLLDFPSIDTLTLARRTLPNAATHKLSDLIIALGLGDAEDAHDAFADIVMVLDLVKWLAAETGKTYAEMAEWSATPELLPVMNFGKFKGKPFAKVPWHYIKFITEKFDTPHPDLVLSVKHYFGKDFDKVKK